MDTVYQSDVYVRLIGVSVKRGKGHLLQENRGKRLNFEENKDNILEQGAYENKFYIWGNKETSQLFRGTRNQEPHPLPERALDIIEATVYRQDNGIPYYSKFTIVIHSNDVRRNTSAVQVTLW